MRKPETVAPSDKAFPVAGVYLFRGVGDGGREEVLRILQDFKKLRRGSLSGFLEHNISGSQCSMKVYHLQIFLRTSAILRPDHAVKGVAVTLKHKVKSGTSQGFEVKNPGYDFLTSVNIVLSQATHSGGTFSLMEARNMTRSVRLILVALVVGCLVAMTALSVHSNSVPAYIGNARSYVFHRQTCRHLPTAKNRTHFDTRAQAIDAGYRPCRKCKP